MSNADIKIGSNRDINKDHKKLLPPDDDVPKIVNPAARNGNPKILTEKHNDEKLVTTLVDCSDQVNFLSFLVKNKWYHYYSQPVVPW